MCGIAGIWNLDGAPVEPIMLDRFTDSLAHRGPDSRGTWRDPEAALGLGHRRLAILDLSPAGHQPMSFADGRYWITYNGEVFNFVELRAELAALGHKFLSESDTEVILAAYVQWGQACQLRFNGMWAFAIWDRSERILFLSRDRFGIKPLHYVVDGRFFAFASEMKAFVHLDRFECAMDVEVLGRTLADINGLEATEDCLLKGVKRLIGGHCLSMRPGRPPVIRKWWNTLDHLVEVPGNFPEQVEAFRELFFDACRIRMRSDVPLATSLSGGLDSSSVLCTLHALGQSQRFTKDWQKAFVACYPGTELDEVGYAREVIEAKRADPIYTEIGIGKSLAAIGEMIYQMEDVNWVLPAGLWMNYKAMRDNRVAVSMDGHGADELLGGYHFLVEAEMRNALYPLPRPGRYLDLRNTLRGFSGGSNAVDKSRWGELRTILSTYKRGILGSGSAAAPGNGSALQGLSRLNRNLHVHFHRTVLPTILRNFNRASMAHGVEIRMPFMDWRLVCFGFSLPDASKMGSGYAKRILREAMRGTVPESIRLRTNKIGFTSPMEQWLRGPLREFLMDILGSADFGESGLWDGKGLKGEVEAVLRTGRRTPLAHVWPYVNAQVLMNQFNLQRQYA